jgi:hypothetical protein
MSKVYRVVIPNVPDELTNDEIREEYVVDQDEHIEVQRNLFSNLLDVTVVTKGEF